MCTIIYNFQVLTVCQGIPESMATVKTITVNVDIFECLNFRGFIIMGNFMCIKIRLFSITSSLCYYKCNFHDVHIFTDI